MGISGERQLNWLDAETLEFGGVQFLTNIAPEMHRTKSTSSRFYLLKDKLQLDEYVKLADELHPRRVVELGVLQGGSTVLYDKLFNPSKLIAFELGGSVPALDAYVAQNGSGRINVNYGVNQVDRSVITEVLRRELGTEPLDLVIDDASHLLRETRTSFNILFPRLRPGGCYVVEDWGWEHWPGRFQEKNVSFAGTPALTNLVFEFVMTAASRPDVVANVQVRRDMAIVRRGEASIGDDFDISRSYLIRDHAEFATLFSPSEDSAFALARRLRRLTERQPMLKKLMPSAAKLARKYM